MRNTRKATNHSDRQATARTWVVWLFWPYIVLALTVPWLILAGISYDIGGSSDFWQPLQAVGSWSLPIWDEALGLTGIVATILVAAAATTGFGGDWRGITARARAPLQATLIVSLSVLAVICSLTLPAAIADPAVLPRALIVCACGWLISFVGMSILEVATPEQELERARGNLLARRMRVSGLTRPPSLPAHRRTSWMAEVLVWGVPTLAWLAGAVAPTVIQFAGTPMFGLSAAIAAVLYFLPLLIIIGWRATVDRSSSRASRWTVRSTLAVPALIGAVSVALTLAGTPLRWLGWLALVFCITLAAILYSGRLPWARSIEDAATALGLRSAREAFDRARVRSAHNDAAAGDLLTG